MDALLSQYIQITGPLVYLVLFVAIILEGDVTLFTAAFLARQSILPLGWTMLVSFLALCAGDLAWYWAGLLLHDGSGIYRWGMRLAKPLDHNLSRRPIHTLFISKFTYGLGHIMMMRAGSLKMAFSHFLKINMAATTFWFLVVAGLGYLSSASLSVLKHYFRFTEFALLAGIIVLLIIQGIVTYRVRKSPEE